LDLENILKEVDRMVDGLDALGEEKLRLRWILGYLSCLTEWMGRPFLGK
jgi:hypothetical protein